MLDELNKIIDSQKELLNNLPKNNKKNIKKYKEQINTFLDEFNNLKESITNEINKRYELYNNGEKNPKIDEVENYLKVYTTNFYLLTDYNSSFEKSSLDRLTYNISKYYKTSLEDVNENLNKAVKIFKDVGIVLKPEDFCYSFYTFEYMKTFLTTEDNNILKDKFNELYWQCSDIITHLELNIKYLYYKNQKNFDNYYLVNKVKFLSKKPVAEIINQYNELRASCDKLIGMDTCNILNLFKERTLVTTDFNETKLDSFYLTQDVEDLLKFKYSIMEYQEYKKVSYIIDSFKKLYVEKDKYKNLSKATLKEINKNEKELFKENKKYQGMLKKGKDTSLISVKTNKIITTLKEKYDTLLDDYFKERIFSSITDSSTYLDILNFVYYNYVYFVKIIKEENPDIEDAEIQLKIKTVEDLIINPYLTLLKNITINEEKDIRYIISDAYSLSKFTITPENFDNEADLEVMANNLNKVIIYKYIKTKGMSIDNIKFVCDVTNLIESAKEQNN